MFFRFALYGFLKNLRFFDIFIVLIFLEAGLSYLEIGLLYAIREVTTNLAEIPTGIIADVYGRKRSMVFSMLVYIVSFVIFFFLASFYGFALAMFCYAIADAFRTGTHKALIFEHLKLRNLEDHKVIYYGSTRAVSQFGSAINSLLAGGLVLITGEFRYVFVATILPYIFNLLNLATYPDELDAERVRVDRGALISRFRAILRGILEMFKDPQAMRAILNSSGFTAFFKSTKDFLQPIINAYALSIPIWLALKDDQRSAVIIGLVYFVIFLLSSLASRNSSRFSQRFRNLAAALNTTFALGALVLLATGMTLLLDLPLISIVAFLAFYVVQNLRKPMNVALVSDNVQNRVLASGFSIESQTATLLVAILAPLFGVIADFGGLGAGLASMGALLLVLAFLVRVREDG